MKKNKIKLILAPLHDFTDVIFRNIYSDYFSGFDEAIAPFISTMDQQRINPSRIRDVLPELNQKLAVTPQILSNSPKDFVFLASHLSEMGHSCVNWNLGCPQLKIVKKKKGSGFMPFVDDIDAFLDIVLKEMTVDLSIKIRLGRESPDEIYPLLKVFDNYPLREIILHPRTGSQFYNGSVDVDAFASVLKETNHNMVYNGDITSKSFFNKIRKRFPSISRFMIGRGVLENPFLPAIIKNINENPAKGDVKTLYDFINELFHGYREVKRHERLLGRMKSFWTYFNKAFQKNDKAYRKILLSQTENEYMTEVENFFSSVRVAE